MSYYYFYPACIEQDTDDSYFVEFPDLKGCFSSGKTQNDAILNAQNALAIYIEEYKKNNLELPAPSNINQLMSKEPHKFYQIIVLDAENTIVKRVEPIKKTLTIPKWLNEIAIKYNLNFSHVLRNALVIHLMNNCDISNEEKKLLMSANQGR